MRLLVIAVAILIPASAGAISVPAPVVKGPLATSENCPRTTSYQAYRDGEPLMPHKLTELPPANAYSAVYRRISGCEVPVVVKYGVGRR